MSAIVGALGIVVPSGKPTVIVSPAPSEPEPDVVNPVAQVVEVEAAREVPVKLTVVTVVAALIVTFDGEAPVASALVETTRLLAAVIVWAVGFVTPAMVKAPLALLASAHDAPARVIVTVGPLVVPFVDAVEPVAVQLVYEPVSVIVGVDGTVNPFENCSVIVSPTLSAPVELAVNPIVHVERVRAVWGEPVKVTLAGVVAAAITTFDAGLAAVVSADVATVRFAAVIVCAAGFVTPAIAKLPVALLASAHEAPASVTVSVGPVAEPAVVAVVPVAVQLEKLPPGVIVGLVGSVNPAENWIVTVSPSFKAPVAVAVNPTV